MTATLSATLSAARALIRVIVADNAARRGLNLDDLTHILSSDYLPGQHHLSTRPELDLGIGCRRGGTHLNDTGRVDGTSP